MTNVSPPDERPPRSSDTEQENTFGQKAVNASIIGTFMILLIGGLYFAQNLLLPIILAFLFALILSPVVRTLKRHSIHEGVSALLLVIFVAISVSGAVYALSDPVTKWVTDAPQIGQELRVKLSSFREPMEKIQQAQKQVEEATSQKTDPSVQEVVVKEPGLLSRAAQGAPEILAGSALTLVLLLFLLASGDIFYEKLVRVLPTLTDKKRGLRIAKDVEREVSRYLLTISTINVGLGLFIAGGLYAIGMPNPLLWGVAATVFNFVPYLGAIFGIAIVALVAVVSLPTLGHAAIAPALYMVCTAIEGQFVTPALVGRRLQINAIAVFLAIACWGWLWGVAGIFVAVPMLIVVKVFSRHVDGLSGLNEFLSARDAENENDGI